MIVHRPDDLIDLDVVAEGLSCTAATGKRTVAYMIAQPKGGGPGCQLAAAGTNDLSREQKDFAFSRGWIAVPSGGKPKRHAEIAALMYCADNNLYPRILATDNATCVVCRQAIAKLSGYPHPAQPNHVLYWDGAVDLASRRDVFTWAIAPD